MADGALRVSVCGGGPEEVGGGGGDLGVEVAV
jgi:hypothetical protein